MRGLKSAVAALAAMIVMTACNSNDRNPVKAVATSSPAAQTAQQEPGDGVRRITTVELRDLIEKGKAIVVDVRNEDAYKAGHIKGARLMPAADIVSRAGELPRDKMIVTYCT